MDLTENIKLALRSIKSNLLRTALTFLIIAFGIMALVGILTSIESIKASINTNFTSMGANSFTVRNKGMHIRKKGEQVKKYTPIKYEEAVEFKERYYFPSVISISTRASRGATVKYLSKKTSPNVTIMAGDENYLAISGFEIETGRNFSEIELLADRNVILLGSDVAMTLFKNKNEALNEIVSVDNKKYKVIGVLKSKGSSMISSDNIAFIPLKNADKNFADPNRTFVVGVSVMQTHQLDGAVAEATGIMRNVRKVRLNEEDNFEISKSDSIASMLIDNIKYVTLAAVIIGFITLFGAAIGLMNIMLVSVTERTREIGICKALGATKKMIRIQFLVEALAICQIGGLLGIVLGIFAGNGVSLLLGGSFIIPWMWIFSGIAFCFVVGMASGIYPAIKASELDPIEALRYE